MPRSLPVLCILFGAALGLGFSQPAVRVESPNLQGPRPLPEQTGNAAIRDYLQSWKSFSAAFEHNRADLLDSAFVGTARNKLAQTIQQQAALGISTRYQDRSHDIQIVFYSPDGLSIELTDKVEYDVQVLDRDRIKTAQHISARYVIVLTPAEVQWRVRVFQAALN
jgi:predicted PhzF superfamily epimerase YddE/YHI9